VPEMLSGLSGKMFDHIIKVVFSDEWQERQEVYADLLQHLPVPPQHIETLIQGIIKRIAGQEVYFENYPKLAQVIIRLAGEEDVRKALAEASAETAINELREFLGEIQKITGA